MGAGRYRQCQRYALQASYLATTKVGDRVVVTSPAGPQGCMATEVLKSKPAMFTSDGLTVHQHFATSLDGTKVPYIVICRADMPLDGSNATLSQMAMITTSAWQKVIF